MRFNKYLPEETRNLLENQYKEYIKTTPMTKKEKRALREWVKDGHSVYENDSCAWNDGQIPVEFLTVYRDEEYIRQHTKGMSSEETRRFAMAYYGWDDEPASNETILVDALAITADSLLHAEELPFR